MESREYKATDPLDLHENRDVLVGKSLVTKLRKLTDEEVLFGHVELFGSEMNVTFIRVEGGHGEQQAPVYDPHCRWDALVEAEPEGVFSTVEVPGFEGQYVFFVSPQME